MIQKQIPVAYPSYNKQTEIIYERNYKKNKNGSCLREIYLKFIKNIFFNVFLSLIRDNEKVNKNASLLIFRINVSKDENNIDNFSFYFYFSSSKSVIYNIYSI